MNMSTLDGIMLEEQGAAFLLMSNVIRMMPEKGWLKSLVIEDVFDEVPYAQNQPAAIEGLAAMQKWAASYTEDSFDGVYDDCMRLLVGPGKPLASPWESVYNEASPGLIFQQETLDVRSDYKALGLQVENIMHEPDDSIAYEMEFVSVLCGKAVEALEAGNVSLAMAAQEAKVRFLKRHLLRWGFEWCNKMTDNARTDFYRGVALLVRGFLTEAKAEADRCDFEDA